MKRWPNFPTMLEVPKGKIALRDDRTKRQWFAQIEPFYLAQYPVTQNFYFEVIQQNPSTFVGGLRPIESITWHEAVVFCNILSSESGLQPVYTCVSNELIAFDASLSGFRLPTEAEWEYACRAGSDGIRYAPLDKIAWYKGNSANQTHDVGQKTPNAWGFYDMLGNVWEWCSDVYDADVYGSYRVFRGGGWCDQERSVMATTRRRSHPFKFSIDDLGFRIARSKVL